MKLAELTTAGFTDLLASDAPAPGGGSAAALEGALGAALTAMVCSLTVGKKKYAEHEELARSVQAKANELRTRFVDVMDRDTEAFNVVSAAFGMPKATDEEKAARSAAIQEGLKGCTKTPFEMMELAVETWSSPPRCWASRTTAPPATWGCPPCPCGPPFRGPGSMCSSISAA